MTHFTEEQLREIADEEPLVIGHEQSVVSCQARQRQDLARHCLDLMDAKANREHLLNDALEALKELEEQKRALQEENEALANKDETGTLVTNYYDLRTEFGGKPGESPFEVVMAWKTATEDRERAALARAEAAEALLRPFAEEEKTWSRSVADDYRPGILEPNQRTALAKAEFSIGDLRRAAAHLATVPQQSTGRFRVSVQEMVEAGDRKTYWVCLDRPDRPTDAKLWEPGRMTPFKSHSRNLADFEATTWARFLGTEFESQTSMNEESPAPLPAQTEARDGA